MLGAFALFCGVMLLAGWLVLLRDWWISARWNILPGTVRGTLVEAARQTDPLRPWKTLDGYRPVVRYAYRVDDQTYLGTRYSATREPFFVSHGDAEAFTLRYSLGSAVSVRVNPDNPTACLLVRQLTTSDAMPGYLALGCVFVGVLLL